VKRAAAAAALAVLAGAAGAQDAERGRALYETHCGTCHYERLHKRATTKIRTLAELRLEVARWAAETTRPIGPRDQDDIVEYLNRSHYRLRE